MPWQCLLCTTRRTYRRDKQCSRCRPTQRGRNNKLVPTTRLRRKQSLVEVTHKRRVVVKHVEAFGGRVDPDVETYKEALLSLFNDLRAFLTMADLHSIMCNAHNMLDNLKPNPGAIPPFSRESALALVFAGMDLSARVTSDDMDKLKKILLCSLKQNKARVIAAHCQWINATNLMRGSLLGD